jgi:hypothetical protein
MKQRRGERREKTEEEKKKKNFGVILNWIGLLYLKRDFAIYCSQNRKSVFDWIKPQTNQFSSIQPYKIRGIEIESIEEKNDRRPVGG